MRLAILLIVLLPQSPDVREIIEKFKSDDITVREEAFKKLKELGDSAEAELVKAEKDAHAEVSSRAGKLLHLIRTRRELTPNLRTLVPGIEERLAFGDGHAWTEALNEILAWKDARWPKLKRADLDCLAARAWEFAREEERQDLKVAVEGLRLRGAIPAIIKNLEFYDAHDSKSLVDTFECRETVIPKAVDLLKHSSPSVRYEAAALLDWMGAYDAYPFVLPLLHDENKDVREAAALFFREAKRPEAAPALRKLLDDPEADVRWIALEALQPLAGEEVFARLLKVKEEPKPYMRSQMTLLFQYYRRKEAGPAVIELLKDPEARVRAVAVDILRRWSQRE